MSTRCIAILAAVFIAAGCSPDPGSDDVSQTPEATRAATLTRIRVAPYADMGGSGAATLSQLSAGSGIKAFNLAFVTAAGCRASWFSAFDPRSRVFRDQIDALRGQGGDVKISFGGPAGLDLATACADVTSLTREYQAVVSAYDLTFVDMDIEGTNLGDMRSVTRRSQALAALQRANAGLKVALTLPVTRQGLTPEGRAVVQSARDAGVSLDVVNILALDFFVPGDLDAFALEAAQATATQLQALLGVSSSQAFRRLGVTVMVGENDDHAAFSQTDAREVLAFAREKGVGFLSFWEANRDRRACRGSITSCTNIPQTPFEFGKIFAAF